MEDKLFKGGTMQNQFNLIDEPWILVREPDDQVQKVSIRKLFKQAQSYTELAGETAPQDFAILRILLAISVVVLMRWDENGNRELLDDEDDAFDRWKCVWKQGHYPSNAVDQYLDEVKDRFWLLSDSHRFMQHEIAKQGRDYESSKLIGCISESYNKKRLFQSRSGEAKTKITPDEAARWLINLNAFDDAAYKNSAQLKEDIKSGRRTKDSVCPVAVSWVGRLGAIYAKGSSLFETLMLNSVLLRNGKELWEEYVPLWEKENEEVLEQNSVIQPDDFCALMTFPSRRLWLNVDQEGMIVGVNDVGGDYFQEENALTEPFTLWKNKNPRKNNELVPLKYQESRLLWQDFQVIIDPDKEIKTKKPGLVDWLEALENEDAYPSNVQIEFVSPAIFYHGSRRSSVSDLTSHSMVLYSKLLAKGSAHYRKMIIDEIDKINRMANAAGLLAKQVAQSLGKEGKRLSSDDRKGREYIYQNINEPFTRWLGAINPSEYTSKQIDFKMHVDQWHQQAYRIGVQFSDHLVGQAPVNGLFGRTISADKKNMHLSVPEAEGIYRWTLRKIYPKELEMKNRQQT